MFDINKETLAQLRAEYPEGSKIVLLKMDDAYNQQPPRGTIGTVKMVDDAGTILPSWDGHGSLGVVYGEDIVKKLTVIPADKDNPFYTETADPTYIEILLLARVLSEKNIPYELKRCCDGWQIGYPVNATSVKCEFIVTQHSYTKKAKEQLLALCGVGNGCKMRELCTADRAFEIIKKYLDEKTESEDLVEDLKKRDYEVTEVCPHCDKEVTLMWNVHTKGYRIHCPVCGKEIILCSQCPFVADDSVSCDWSESKGCKLTRMNKEN